MGVGADVGSQEHCSASLSPAPSLGPRWLHFPLAGLSPLPCNLSCLLTAGQQLQSLVSLEPLLRLSYTSDLRGCLFVILPSLAGPATCLVPASLEGGLAGNEYMSLVYLSRFSSLYSYL